MPDTSKLVKCAMALRAESGEGWNQFVLAMREYAAASTADMLRAPAEMLLKAQGMALASNELAATFNEAPRLYEKMMGQHRNG
jgi:hypothetical protein